MPFTSQAQRGLFHAVEHDPAVAKRTGISQATARKMIAEDEPGKLPEHVGRADGGGLGSPHLRAQFGGGLSFSEMSPWWTRSEARIMDQPLHGGLINSSGAGRTDQIPASVASDSHVLTADVVSGLGQGSSLFGSRLLNEALRIGPYGTPLPREARGPGPPSHSPPHLSPRDMGFQHGGAPHDKTSVLVAGGEYLVPRHDWLARDEHGNLHWHAGVETIGGGDVEKGHRLLNELIHRVRKYVKEFLEHAPPPKA